MGRVPIPVTFTVSLWDAHTPQARARPTVPRAPEGEGKATLLRRFLVFASLETSVLTLNIDTSWQAGFILHHTCVILGIRSRNMRRNSRLFSNYY